MIDPGLCGRCHHARTTGNRRGSVFYLCGKAAEDPRYLKYPALPMTNCPGYQPRPAPEAHTRPAEAK